MLVITTSSYALHSLTTREESRAYKRKELCNLCRLFPPPPPRLLYPAGNRWLKNIFTPSAHQREYIQNLSFRVEGQRTPFLKTSRLQLGINEYITRGRCFFIEGGEKWNCLSRKRFANCSIEKENMSLTYRCLSLGNTLWLSLLKDYSGSRWQSTTSRMKLFAILRTLKWQSRTLIVVAEI